MLGRNVNLLTTVEKAENAASVRAQNGVATIDALSASIAREEQVVAAETRKAEAAAEALSILSAAGF